jgi:hypothetical protein
MLFKGRERFVGFAESSRDLLYEPGDFRCRSKFVG